MFSQPPKDSESLGSLHSAFKSIVPTQSDSVKQQKSDTMIQSSSPFSFQYFEKQKEKQKGTILVQDHDEGKVGSNWNDDRFKKKQIPQAPALISNPFQNMSIPTNMQGSVLGSTQGAKPLSHKMTQAEAKKLFASNQTYPNQPSSPIMGVSAFGQKIPVSVIDSKPPSNPVPLWIPSPVLNPYQKPIKIPQNPFSSNSTNHPFSKQNPVLSKNIPPVPNQQPVNSFIARQFINDPINELSKRVNQQTRLIEEKQRQKLKQQQMKKQASLLQPLAQIRPNQSVNQQPIIQPRFQKLVTKSQLIQVLKQFFQTNQKVQFNFDRSDQILKQRQLQYHKDKVQKIRIQLQEMKNKKLSIARQMQQFDNKTKSEVNFLQSSSSTFDYGLMNNISNMERFINGNIASSGTFDELKGSYVSTQRLELDPTLTSLKSQLQQEFRACQNLIKQNSALESNIKNISQSCNKTLSHLSSQLRLSQDPSHFANKSNPTITKYATQSQKLEEQLITEKEQYLKKKRESGISIAHSALTSGSQEAELRTVVRNVESRGFNVKIWQFVLVIVMAVLVGMYLKSDS